MQLHTTSPLGLGNATATNAKASRRTVERIVDDAECTGDLCLAGRNLKDFPISKNNNLIDTARADVSRNRFLDVPAELCQLVFLEQLNCRENLLRAIPKDFARLTCLVELDISRNNITTIPAALCKLPLQILLISHNRLQTLPVEIDQFRALRELDASCNEISLLPTQLSHLSTLRRLDLRKNYITHLPLEVKKLSLVYLDLSGNSITALPTNLREMSSLQTLLLAGNPLLLPTAPISARGTIHIFKCLERAASQTSAPSSKTPRDFSYANRDERSYTIPVKVSSERFRQPVISFSPTSPVAITAPISLQSRPIPSESIEISAGVYAIPHKVTHRSLPVSTSCPVISKAPLQLAPSSSLSEEKSSTSSPSSSGVVSSTDGVSDEGVDTGHSDQGNVSSDGPRNAPRKSSLTNLPSSQIPKKSSANVVFKPHGAVPSLPTPSVVKSATKPPLQSGGRRLSGGSVTASRDALHTPSSHSPSNGGGSGGGGTSVVGDSSRNLSARSSQQHNKISPARKDGTMSVAPKARVSPHRVTPGSKIGSTLDKAAEAGGKESNPNFTIRRQQEQLREETEKLEMLKKYIETRLKLGLPEDVMESLQDGVVLCHLVNNIRPRSVISIHVPPTTQAGVVKLTPAKSRRNVENFLDACRRLGVAEVLICSSADILEGKSPARLYGCVHSLMQLEAAALKRGAVHSSSGLTTPRQQVTAPARGQLLRDFSAV
ncbi:putative Leucine-rich repeat and calponin-like proteiny domain-containing protein 3 [Hypsibius exemplaris]|uniref:Leucine-rich repeat and calponin-like proteiny domain-containing protein 3 n=1 Tax=Hypsibius exemplaris TaxID=2072580 RepID=A0A1W0X8Q8_HYPEX|nr:putative Leucine-rich repeat and calponin-like proteiny domain-containing protein 3 [Hypsibius exemplaris]